jgi:hypothetical protein
MLSRIMAEPAPARDASASYIADILAKAPPMNRQQRDRLQVLLAQIHSARQQLRTASTASGGRRPAEQSLASSQRAVDAQPLWWSYPAQCSNHHDWKPGSVMVTWQACGDCPAAAANQLGHLRVSCRTPGCSSVWYSPSHLPR